MAEEATRAAQAQAEARRLAKISLDMPNRPRAYRPRRTPSPSRSPSPSPTPSPSPEPVKEPTPEVRKPVKSLVAVALLLINIQYVTGYGYPLYHYLMLQTGAGSAGDRLCAGLSAYLRCIKVWYRWLSCPSGTEPLSMQQSITDLLISAALLQLTKLHKKSSIGSLGSFTSCSHGACQLCYDPLRLNPWGCMLFLPRHEGSMLSHFHHSFNHKVALVHTSLGRGMLDPNVHEQNNYAKIRIGAFQ